LQADKLQTLLKAAGITEVEPIWSKLFANALEGKDVRDILTAVAASGPRAGGEAAARLGEGDGVGGGDDGVVYDDGSKDDCDDTGDEGMFGLFD
jgi:large subunit ribosomal protein LP1